MTTEQMPCIFNIQRFSLHDGPGIRTTVFFKGCPLRCPWCSNPESQHFVPERMWDNIKKDYTMVGEYMSIEHIMEMVLKDKDYYLESGGGVTLSGGEVLAQPQAALALISACKAENLHVACETSGFASKKIFLEVVKQLDLLIIDIKHYDSKKHLDTVGCALDPIIENIRQAVNLGVDMIVRIPVIPFFNNSVDDIKSFARLLHELKISQVELLPFHQFGQSKYKFLNRDYDYRNVKQLQSKELLNHKDIFEQEGISTKI